MNTPSAPSAASAENPWLRAFLTEPWDETIFGLIVIRRKSAGFELRHHKDFLATDLKPIRLPDLRPLVNFTATQKFRPLKSTPDLQTGWVLSLANNSELEQALQIIHPNSLADRFLTTSVTPYRAFTARQSGMYQITANLPTRNVVQVIENLCNSNCAKNRFWPVDGSGPTLGSFSTMFPCLEPCPLFLEAARKEAKNKRVTDEASEGLDGSHETADT